MKLAQASGIIEAAMAHGREKGAAPLAIVVLDAGGNMVAAQRQDGCGLARMDMALGKAWGALGLGMGTRTLAERFQKSPHFFASAATLLDGRLLPSPGGVLVKTPDGQVLGAVGVSGDVGDVDEACIVEALTALNYSFDL